MTRSGRIYGAESSKKTYVFLTKDKGKTVIDTNQETKSPNKDFSDQKAEEFLKVIKKSDYRVVDQLHQTPAKISILSLLINSEAHRDSLMKVLSSAHVAKEISVNQFDNVVANLTSGSYLGFCNNELPSQGRAFCTPKFALPFLMDFSSQNL